MDDCPSILKKNLRGMSLTEILIVVTLLSIIAVVLISAFQPGTQLAKARDARRKADMQKLKNPLEDYYNDKKCYPDPSLLNCKLPADNPGTNFQPYKDKVPCDPETGQSYVYEKVDCNTYRIYVNLENESDPDIAAAGCANGCGPSPYYNWGISSPNVNLEPVPTAAPVVCDKGWVMCSGTTCHVWDGKSSPKWCGDCPAGSGCSTP